MNMYRARIMLVGQDRAGKTSLKKSFLDLPFDPQEDSTDGIEVDSSKFEVDIDQVKNWKLTDEKLSESQFALNLANIAARKIQERDKGKEDNEENGDDYEKEEEKQKKEESKLDQDLKVSLRVKNRHFSKFAIFRRLNRAHQELSFKKIPGKDVFSVQTYVVQKFFLC